MTASDLVTSRLTAGDRVAVIGAGGWFGTSLLRLLSSVANECVIPVASVAREHVVGGRTWHLREWDAVAEAEPSVVVGLAALTANAPVAPEVLAATNRDLTTAIIELTSRPSVRAAVLLSSGAALTMPDSAYGREKADLESRASVLVTASRAVVVARAWSVSGPDVRDPRAYAFSDFVAQAATGVVTVNATRPVLRRYVDAGEYLAVCLASALDGWSGTVDSGGDLVELGELAHLVAAASSPPATVVRPPLTSSEPSRYAGDDSLWQAACRRVGFVPMTLSEQVRKADRGHSQRRRA